MVNSDAPSPVEEWRQIPSAPGYEASSLGRVRNRSTGRVLVQVGRGGRTGAEYQATSLGRGRKEYVHALVLEAFGWPRPSRRHVVNHKDECKRNNRPSNLAWITGLGNTRYYHEQRRRERRVSSEDIVGSERQAGDVF